jgi:hypothetical protein
MEQPSPDLHPAYFQVRFRTEAPQVHWPDQFVILTAYATTGETWSPERNTEADQRLHAELMLRGCTPLRITGYDPQSGHAEPGWAVELPTEEALAVGRDFLQDAIFFVEDDVLHVWACRGGHAPALVGNFKARLTPVTGNQ